MNYDNSAMLRQDRIMSEDTAEQLLASAEMGVLSMVTPDGRGYGIPVNFVWDGGESIFFHCAEGGKKIDCMKENPDVSFCICGKSRVVPGTLSTERESLIVECVANLDLSVEEKKKGLLLLMEKLDKDNIHKARCIDSAIDKVSVIKLNIRSVSGKAKYFK